MSCRTRPIRLLYAAPNIEIAKIRHGAMLTAAHQIQFGTVNASQFRTGMTKKCDAGVVVCNVPDNEETSNAAVCAKVWAFNLHMAMRGSRSYTIRTDSEWGGRGPLAESSGSFPPASEREARMDDPMIRSA